MLGQQAAFQLNPALPAVAAMPPSPGRSRRPAPVITPLDDSVLGDARFERAVVTLRRLDVPVHLQALHREPGRRVWLCGSCACAGIPLL